MHMHREPPKQLSFHDFVALLSLRAIRDEDQTFILQSPRPSDLTHPTRQQHVAVRCYIQARPERCR